MSVVRVQSCLVTVVLIGLAAFLSGCDLQQVWTQCEHRGEGAMKIIKRNFSEYSQIRLRNDISAEITVGDTASFSIDIYENVAEYLDMHVESGVLSLAFNTPQVCNSKAKATITLTEPLQGASGESSGFLDIDLLTGFLNSFGSGSVSVGKLSAEEASIMSSGSGSVKVRGVEAGHAEVTSSGSGSVSLNNLKAPRVSMHSSGSGSLEVHSGQASQSADITVSGSGSISLSGFETKTASIVLTGSGSLTGMTSSNLDFGVSGSGGIQTTVTGTVSGSCSGSGSASITGGATESGPKKCFGRRLMAV